MEYGEIYFQGFFFKQDNINNLDEAKEFINTMFDTLLDNDFYNDNDINIIFLNNYNNFYFKTNFITDKNVVKLYKSILFNMDNNMRENTSIYHFFRINNKYNHIELYKRISNIENIKRLLIAFAYHLAPNLPYKKKDNIIFANDINKYRKAFLELDKKILDFKKLKNNKQELKYHLNIFKEYLKFEKIKKKIVENENTCDLSNIRGAIAHNKIPKTYEPNNIKTKALLNYQEDTKSCKIIYKEFHQFLKRLLKKNKHDELNMQIK